MPAPGCALMIHPTYASAVCIRSLYRDFLAWRLDHPVRWSHCVWRGWHGRRENVGKG